MKALELVGRVFGRLTVMCREGSKNQKALWRCACNCGNQTLVITYALTDGRVRSCGCLLREHKARFSSRKWYGSKTHGATMGGSATGEYRVWAGIKTRCYNPRHKDFSYYGARGITMAPQWIDDFQQFLSDVGPKPSTDMTLDRKNNDGNYEPGNVVWATRKEQCKTRRPRGTATTDQSSPEAPRELT